MMKIPNHHKKKAIYKHNLIYFKNLTQHPTPKINVFTYAGNFLTKQTKHKHIFTADGFPPIVLFQVSLTV